MTRTAPKAAYDILGVSPEDDFATIRKAWLTQARANHPDVVRGDVQAATRRLAELNDAYDALRWHRVLPDARTLAEQRAEVRANRRREAARRAELARQADAARRAEAERLAAAQRRATAARRADAAHRDPGQQRPTAKRAATPAERFESARLLFSGTETRRTLCFA